MSENILELQNVTKHFPIKMGMFGSRSDSKIHAVDGVSFILKKGKTLGLVGESGCGKTTLAKIILKLIPPTTGKIMLFGQDIHSKEFSTKTMRKKIQLIFQDPYSSLNPRMTVYDLIGEAFDIHKIAKGKKKKEKIIELLELVGLAPYHLYRYPHEFSGGQRQRIVIARALAVKPEVLIMDEPVSALDISVRAQILNLLEELQEKLELSYIFISHDLSIVRYICDSVALMYLGEIIEFGETEDVFINVKHPYSKALLDAVPVPDPRSPKKAVPLLGEVPTAIDPPLHCRFAKRCKYAKEKCFKEIPNLIEINNGHYVSCFFPLNN